MLIKRNIDKVCSCGVSDQVVATRGERTHNVRVIGSSVPSNNTVAHCHAITALLCSSCGYATPSLLCPIAIDGAEGNSNLTSLTEDASPIRSSRIARDSTVSKGEHTSLIIDATTTGAARASNGCTVTRDSTVSEGKFPSVEDATTADEGSSATRCLVVGDSTVHEGERSCVEDASATEARRAVTGNALVRGDNTIVRDDRINEGKFPSIEDATTTDER